MTTMLDLVVKVLAETTGEPADLLRVGLPVACQSEDRKRLAAVVPAGEEAQMEANIRDAPPSALRMLAKTAVIVARAGRCTGDKAIDDAIARAMFLQSLTQS